MCPECGVIIAGARQGSRHDGPTYVRLLLVTLAGQSLLLWAIGIRLWFRRDGPPVWAGVMAACVFSVAIVLVLLFRDQLEARWKLAYGMFLASIALFLLSGCCLCFPLLSKAT
jgi:hypothetical protein